MVVWLPDPGAGYKMEPVMPVDLDLALTVAAVLFCIRSYMGNSTWSSTDLYQPQVVLLLLLLIHDN